VDLCSTVGKVAMGPAGSRSGMVAQGPDSNWASGPSCQGGDRSAEVVPLVVQLVWPGRATLGVRLEQVAPGMVLRVQAGAEGAGWVGGIGGGGPDCAAGQVGTYIGHCWGAAEKW